ncbi:MAG TPA: NUDIX domain-containing protein [Anaerolineales bacterium]|nr:NUDIX domain-containing protein [Anaerolineales bacterium]
MIKKTLLKIWRELPVKVQLLVVRLLRPRYRVAVAAIIMDNEGRILLCEHTYRKIHPWGLPGGGLEFGESPECGIEREVWEETGFKVNVEKLLFAESSQEYHHIGLVYLCKIVSGSFVPNLETSQVKFFSMDNLPSLLSNERKLIERLVDQFPSWVQK